MYLVFVRCIRYTFAFDLSCLLSWAAGSFRISIVRTMEKPHVWLLLLPCDGEGTLLVLLHQDQAQSTQNTTTPSWCA